MITRYMPTESTLTRTDYRIIVTTPGGTDTIISPYESIQPFSRSSKSPEKRISPWLYFKFVKSKLKKNEILKLKERLKKLQALTKNAFDLDQEALYQEYAKMLAVIVRESEAAVCGYDTWVDIKDIDKFKHIVKEAEADQSPVYFKKLQDFPRTIPATPAKIIKQIKEKRIFDQLWILYLDYTHVELKTNKDKIREKDPIIFGQFAYAKDRYYYITDYVDEHCDLTMEGFIGKLKKNDPEYDINETPEIDQTFIEKIKAEVLERHERLSNAKGNNYKDLMKEEDREKLKEELRKEIAAESKKKSGWKRLLKRNE